MKKISLILLFFAFELNMDNIASKRVMEKIGMRYLGADEDIGHLFTLTREEYFRIERY